MNRTDGSPLPKTREHVGGPAVAGQGNLAEVDEKRGSGKQLSRGCGCWLTAVTIGVVDADTKSTVFAGVVQWQNFGFPSRSRGFDSRRLLQKDYDKPARRLASG